MDIVSDEYAKLCKTKKTSAYLRNKVATVLKQDIQMSLMTKIERTKKSHYISISFNNKNNSKKCNFI